MTSRAASWSSLTYSISSNVTKPLPPNSTDLFETPVHDSDLLACELGLSAEILQGHGSVFWNPGWFQLEKSLIHGAVRRGRHGNTRRDKSVDDKNESIAQIQLSIELSLFTRSNIHWRHGN
jgi:hypothetical protein